ncbi:MAG: ATP synthase F0 subunit B [Deltaproteobacteria bacterium]|nr:ATP synthase F0 subunit B [Deltaproteobacteria bacterium]
MIRLVPLLLALPGAALASHEGGAVHIPWASLGFHTLNLTLLLVALFLLLRRPLADTLASRSALVRREVQDAHDAREAAVRRLEDLEERLAGFEFQVDGMRREMAEQAEEERQAIVDRAHREAEAIRSAAERAIRDEVARARRGLQEEVVTLSVALARQLLERQVGEADQDRLVGELLARMGQDRAGSPGRSTDDAH